MYGVASALRVQVRKASALASKALQDSIHYVIYRVSRCDTSCVTFDLLDTMGTSFSALTMRVGKARALAPKALQGSINHVTHGLKVILTPHESCIAC